MLKRLKSVSMMLFLMGASTGAAYAVSNPGITDVKVAQQDEACTGIVKDATGETVIGASVVVKGTTNGTITGIDGDFSLSNVKKGDILQISFVGYITQEVKWNGTPLNIILKDDTQTLEEVVVVGYGTQKKVNLTGAVAMAESDVLEDRPIANLAQGLQGAIPNLNISFANGNPNSSTSINVRGLTSLNGGSALILVDGVETNDISLLNPQDIESISVLKDASSAAVYGARAAFGVVLITTKKGKKGEKVTFNYNNNFSWSAPSRMAKGLPADQWLRAMNVESNNTSGTQYWSDELIAAVEERMKDPSLPTAWENTQGNKFTANGEWAYAGNTDWLDVLFNDAAFMQQHNASVRGGSEKTSYYGSVGYKGQDGLLAYGTDHFKRINMSFNFNTQLTNWLEIGLNVKYNRSEANEPNSNFYTSEDPYYEVYRSMPFIPVYLPDGDFAGVAGSNFNFNIAGMLAQAGRTKNVYDDIWYTGSFKLTPFKGLTVRGDYTGNRYFRTTRAHEKTIYQKQPDGTSMSKGDPNGVSLKKYDDTYEALNLWAEYKKSFGDHSLTAMVGYNQESKETSNMYGKTTGLFVNDIPVIDLAGTKQNLEEEATIWAVQGAFFRLNYDYKGKYLLEVNGRYDGSSKYGEDDRWGFFPSASIGWRLSEEKFFDSARNIFENVKLRASVGSLGNQVTTGNFDYLSSMGFAQLNYLLNGKLATGITPASLAYNNVSWEKVTTANFGLDLGLLNNRLTASFDYFIRYTNDMVVSKTYPATMGSTGGKENLANMRTNGWELSLSWKDQIANVGGSPLDYNVGIGISDSYSKITKYDNPTGYLGDYYEGMELGEIWGYVTDGFIQDKAEAEQQAVRQKVIATTWLPGDIRYADLDENGAVDYGKNTLSDHGDKKIIGNNTPRYRFNINLGASWKGFDIRALFEGTMKRDLWLGTGSTGIFWGYYGQWWSTLNDTHLDYWTPENPNAYYPTPTNTTRSRQTQTKYLQDASYIRLKDVTIGYNLPQAWISKFGIAQLRIFASGQNLWEATGLYKYLDPDATGNRKKDGEMEDRMTKYPFCRTYSFGINVTF